MTKISLGKQNLVFEVILLESVVSNFKYGHFSVSHFFFERVLATTATPITKNKKRALESSSHRGAIIKTPQMGLFLMDWTDWARTNVDGFLPRCCEWEQKAKGVKRLTKIAADDALIILFVEQPWRTDRLLFTEAAAAQP